MKKTIILFLLLISILFLLIRFGGQGLEFLLGIKGLSGLTVTSAPEGAAVILDGKEIGITPFESKGLEPKEYDLKIQKDNLFWQGKVKLNEGTITVVSRELSQDPYSSVGEILTLTKGRGITVLSNPQEAELKIDGKAYGKTPITVAIDSGEHNISLNHSNYLERNTKANLPEGYNLIVLIDLQLSEADLTSVQTPVITQTLEVVVLDTPTGFLRVRDKPSLAGKEITQVKPGDKLILLEELPSWARVRLADGTEGYVSATYIEKEEQ
ncbi:PEGA domain-containing protein [Candidatus Daviesbacteria bacterium]|nr:PEGA domain-containing protein [Candidatus Daviesbacteria bacterium]MBI4035350.1 PEGA domain-containing protein [Candidatus Daviesbacteria bacterium]